MAIEIITGFESTYLPVHDVDVAELTEHTTRWRDDLRMVREAGVRRLRYPLRWHRIEKDCGRYDWEEPDAILGFLAEQGLAPVLDLLHGPSHPRWLKAGVADKAFPDAFVRFAEAAARRYGWVDAYTICNEPFTLCFFCGSEGIWFPFLHGTGGFARVAEQLVPAVQRAASVWRELVPGAAHWWVDVCESHVAGDWSSADHATMANDRRFALIDLVLGLPLDPARPFVRRLRAAGGGRLIDAARANPARIDVLGLDYYAHAEWLYTWRGGESPSSRPVGLAALAEEYHRRYRLPVAVTETNIRGYASDRATWAKYVLEQCEIAQHRGVPVTALCWFPFVDSCDWDSMLRRPDRHLDPVGVYWCDGAWNRHPSSMLATFTAMAAGAGSAALPAYRLQPPVDVWLRGFAPAMAHWDWVDPPAAEVVPPGGRSRH